VFEVLPVIAGLGIGLMWAQLAGGWRRWVLIGTSSLVVGTFVAATSGELAESPLFILLDTGTALLGAVVGVRLASLRTARARREG
jgi:hypothetical protein